MKPQIRTALALSGLALLSTLLGCRGQTSEKPPIWIKHGMENQPKLVPYGHSEFFEDGRNMRHPPEGTVAVGLLKEDDLYYRGGKDTASYGANPLRITGKLLERGQERYQIYCTPCHGQTGVGNGMVISKGFIIPTNLHDPRVLAMPDGQLFHAVTYGVRNMPSYGKQIPEEDRWAIVAYMRALQRSTHASINDVPESERANLK